MRRVQVSANSTTPMDTAESATLNTGQCQRLHPISMKSTTSPLVTRSNRLPRAPPRMSDSASCTGSPWACRRTNIHRIATAATIEKMKNGNPLPAPMPNATPELRV